MAHSVVFAPEAEADLVELYEYIARHGGFDPARRYVERIVTMFRSLTTFSERGTRRDDIRPGLRPTAQPAESVRVMMAAVA
ncbi:MAG: type II toxin-antitoxin system RelE/ParE family toxin [Acetobacteraceae bacterium]